MSTAACRCCPRHRGDAMGAQLATALAKARKSRAAVVVAKLDRLSRDVHFISGLMTYRVPFIVAELGAMPTRSCSHLCGHGRKGVGADRRADPCSTGAEEGVGSQAGQPHIRVGRSWVRPAPCFGVLLEPRRMGQSGQTECPSPKKTENFGRNPENHFQSAPTGGKRTGCNVPPLRPRSLAAFGNLGCGLLVELETEAGEAGGTAGQVAFDGLPSGKNWLSGRGRPRCSRSVAPSYSRRKSPRR